MHGEKAVKKLAEERVRRLFSLAYSRTAASKESDKLARRYIGIARRISSHYKIKIPSELKRAACRKCNSMLMPGKNCTVRLVADKGYIIYRCECGNENRVFYKKSR